MPTPGLNSSGFQVSVMPQVQQIDPRLFAADPSQFGAGALNATQVLGAFQALKQQRAQMAEEAATRDARIANIQALSDMNVLGADAARQTQAPKIDATLANLGLSAAKDKGELASLPDDTKLAALRRQFETQKTESDILEFDTNLKLTKDLTKAKLLESKAQAAKWFAEADAERSRAKLAGLPQPDEAYKVWEKKIGELAAIVGVTPQVMRQIYDNNPKIAQEASALAENIQKHEFFVDPIANISTELQQALGTDGVQKIVDYATAHSINNAPDGVSKPTETSKPGVIKIDSKGNITTPVSPGQKIQEAEAKSEAAKQEIKQEKDTGKSVADSAKNLGLFALLAAGGKNAPATASKVGKGAAKLAKNLWEGRSAAGKFTGNSVKGMPKRALSSFAARGVGALAAPVAAASTANDLLGGLLSDKDTGNMTALEGIAQAAVTPSFDEQARDAKFDEVRHRITTLLQNYNPDDQRTSDELAKLLDQQDVLMSAMQKD